MGPLMRKVQIVAMIAMLFLAMFHLSACGNSTSGDPSDISYVDSEGNESKVEIKSGSFTDKRDGQKYSTVTVGDYTWMAENLNYKLEGSKNSTDYGTSKNYGVLYSLGQAKTACPDGWHLPTLSEWQELFSLLEEAHEDSAGWVLKTTSGWESDEDGTSGNGGNLIGFSVKPTGFYNGYYALEGQYTAFWVDGDMDWDGYATAIRFDYDDADWHSPELYAYRAEIYVRCLNDKNTLVGTLGTCDDSKEDSVGVWKNEHYTCKNSAWKKSTVEESLNFEFGKCTMALFDSIQMLNDTAYICDSLTLQWREAKVYEVLGKCSEKNVREMKTYLGETYSCHLIGLSYLWEEPDANDMLPKCTVERRNELQTFEEITYICADSIWKTASEIQIARGECSEKNVDEISTVNDTSYICLSNRSWRRVNHYDSLYGICTSRKIQKLTLIIDTSATAIEDLYHYDSTYYMCDTTGYRLATTVEINTDGKPCTAAEVGTMTNGKLNPSLRYYCTPSYGWVSVADVTRKANEVPKSARLNPNIQYGTMKDSRDGQVYYTVKIGNQTWLAENLNYADEAYVKYGKSLCNDEIYSYYADGDAGCEVTGRGYYWVAAIDSIALANDKENPVYCGYGKTCDLTGRKVRGACDFGWHIPGQSEWETLLESVYALQPLAWTTPGNYLRIIGSDYGRIGGMSGWHTVGTDTLGFSVYPIPLGNNMPYGAFWAFPDKGQYEDEKTVSIFYVDTYSADTGNHDKNNFRSIRCIKDED